MAGGLARSLDPSLPDSDLATSVAESQASLGLILATAIDEELERIGRPSRAVVVMTRAEIVANRRLLGEEAPSAYKDVASVVEVCDRAGLARKLARMRPMIVVKG